MSDSKPAVGTWLSRGVLAGLFFVFVYLAALGPIIAFYHHGPVAWRDETEAVVVVAYWPVFYGLEEEWLPESVTWPYLAWLDWWDDS
jgi:hypothetical protein